MSSRFKGIFEARQKSTEPSTNGEPEVPVEETPEVVAPPNPAPAPKPEKKPRHIAPAPEPTTQKRLGRPPGKRSHSDYVQVTAYIRDETHRDVKVALIKDGNGQEFSELVQDLLAKWLKSRS